MVFVSSFCPSREPLPLSRCTAAPRSPARCPRTITTRFQRAPTARSSSGWRRGKKARRRWWWRWRPKRRRRRRKGRSETSAWTQFPSMPFSSAQRREGCSSEETFSFIQSLKFQQEVWCLRQDDEAAKTNAMMSLVSFFFNLRSFYNPGILSLFCFCITYTNIISLAQFEKLLLNICSCILSQDHSFFTNIFFLFILCVLCSRKKVCIHTCSSGF